MITLISCLYIRKTELIGMRCIFQALALLLIASCDAFPNKGMMGGKPPPPQPYGDGYNSDSGAYTGEGDSYGGNDEDSKIYTLPRLIFWIAAHIKVIKISLFHLLGNVSP